MKQYVTTTYLYKTQNGNEYPVKLGFTNIRSEEILHNYEYVTGLCRQGCKNYGRAGGCPPFAPAFENIVEKYEEAILVYARLHSKYKTCRVQKSNNYYIHYRFQDIILSNFLNKIGGRARELFLQKIFFLGNGYCAGCGSRKCAFKEGANKCRFPQKRTFSLEATGINVEETLKKVFNLELEWYNQSNFRQVKYLTKVVGFFFNGVPVRNEVWEYLNIYK